MSPEGSVTPSAALFAAGLQQFRRGELVAAEASLARLLQLEPDHFDALHLAGVIASQQGRPQLAVERIRAAIRRNDSVAAAHRHLGNALCASGRHDLALAAYDRAIELRPDFREAHVNRALAALTLGRPAESLAGFDRAAACGADDALLLACRASALLALGRPADALAACDRALGKEPEHRAARLNRAAALYRLHRYPESLADSERAIAADPRSGDAHACRGAALHALGRLPGAMASLEVALRLQPQHALATNVRALCLLEQQRADEALEAVERLLAASPDMADAHNTRGLALADLRRFAESVSAFQRSAALDPTNPEPRFNEGLRYLQAGEFERGWALYEHRPLPVHCTAGNWLQRPRWDGSQDLAGRTLLIHAEQGLGDTLQFCRYAPLLAARGARVVLAVQDSLRTLLTSLGAEIEVVGSGERIASYDFHCPLLSLPLALRTTAATVPARVPYLAADPQRVARWRARLDSGQRLIGIRWQGSTGRADAGRSFALAHFEAIATLPGVRLVSLQKGPGSEQLDELPAHWNVLDLGSGFEPGGEAAFLDVAAVMASLDLVISSDTSIAHLAGALGRPAWVALKYVPDWRWLLDRADSPWYPTLRLFRQSAPGDWPGVFAAMRAALESSPILQE